MRILLTVLFCLCLPLEGAEKEKTDVEKAGYKGRVKSVKVSSFDIEQIDGKLVRTGLVFPGENITKYDEKGNKTEEVSYDATGKITGKYTYKYDEMGNKIKKTSYDFFLPTEFSGNEETWEFTYWN